MDIDIVYHMGARAGVRQSFNDPLSYIKDNTIATTNVANFCKKNDISKMILASTSSIYGNSGEKEMVEDIDEKINPPSIYASTKLSGETLAKTILSSQNTNLIITRFFTVYGPYGRPDMFIHKFLNKIKKKQSIKLHNHGLNYRDFTFVGDVVKIIHFSIIKKLKNNILNICRSKPIITNQLVKMIIKKFPNKFLKIVKTDFVKGEMLKTHGSNKLLQKNIGKISFTDIKIGIDITIREFKKNKF